MADNGNKDDDQEETAEQPPQDRQPRGGQPEGGQPQGGQPQGGQGGQPPAGQPQGGQPQGGQPQGGQPQGGQGGQPQGQPRAQPQGQQPAGQGRAGQSTVEEYSTEIDLAKFGLFVYAVVGIGLFLTESFKFILAGDDSVFGFATQFQDEALFAASISAFDTFTTLAPLVGIFVALYYYRTSTTEPLLKSSAIASAAGVLAVSLVLAIFLTIFSPDGANAGIGSEFTSIIGITVGTVGVTAAVAYLLQEDPLDVL